MFFKGEKKLTYAVKWQYGLLQVTAGYLDAQILAPVFQDGTILHPIHASAKSSSFVGVFYPFHYAIDSLWDQKGYSHQFAMHGIEKSDQKDQIESYDYGKKISSLWQKIENKNDSSNRHEKSEEFTLPAQAQDVLSSLYYLRSANLSTDPQQVFTFSVMVDASPWSVNVKFLEKSKLKVNGSKLIANVYQLDFYKDGKLDNSGSKIWISSEADHSILKMESKVQVGKIWVKLTDKEIE